MALVEKEEMGGTCLNWGCVPTKTLIASSELLAQIKSASAMGLKVENASFDYAAMSDRKDQIIQKLRNGIEVTAQGKRGDGIPGQRIAFESRNKILVEPAAGCEPTTLDAGKTIICTGASLPPCRASCPSTNASWKAAAS